MNKTRHLTKEQIAEYNSNGFIIVPNLFDLEEIQPLYTACEKYPDIWAAESYYKNSDGSSNSFVCYSHLSDSLLGVFPRIARMVDSVEAILGEESYHFHSKLVRKEAYSKSNLDWHQDYGTWYHYGCIFPDLITCGIAISDITRENGCMQVVKKSHLLGLLKHIRLGESEVTDPERLQKVLDKLEIVFCEMKAGDALFFHGNLLHRSTPNYTNKMRIIFHCTYNRMSNEPYKEEWKAHHSYQPLNKLSDLAIREGRYNGIFNQQDFFPAENEEDKGIGLVYSKF